MNGHLPLVDVVCEESESESYETAEGREDLLRVGGVTHEALQGSHCHGPVTLLKKRRGTSYHWRESKL